jgi:hypothetical protein
MFGVIYLQAKDCDGDDVLVGYPAVRLSTHCGAHTPHNHGPRRVEIIVGRLKGRQYVPTFLQAGETPTASNQFVPLTDSPSPMYYGGTP